MDDYESAQPQTREARAAQVCALLAREFPDMPDSALARLRAWGERHFSLTAETLSSLCFWGSALEATGVDLEKLHDMLFERYRGGYWFTKLQPFTQLELFEEDAP